MCIGLNRRKHASFESMKKNQCGSLIRHGSGEIWLKRELYTEPWNSIQRQGGPTEAF